MNQDVGYGPVAKVQEHPSPQWRTPVLLVALALAVLPTVIYLAGLALHSNAPGTCTDWIGCSHSARQQWAWKSSGSPPEASPLPRSSSLSCTSCRG